MLLECTIGNQDTQRWDADYLRARHGRAQLRHGMDSRCLQLMEAHRLARDDGPLWGGVWLDGIAVAASGALPQGDEAFPAWVAIGVPRAPGVRVWHVNAGPPVHVPKEKLLVCMPDSPSRPITATMASPMPVWQVCGLPLWTVEIERRPIHVPVARCRGNNRMGSP